MLQALRVLVALLGLSAVVTEVVVLVGRGTFVPGNFLSFFTIQSNLLAGVTLLLVVTRREAPWLSWLRGLATLCMVVTGDRLLGAAVRACRPTSSPPCRGTTWCCTTWCRSGSRSTGSSRRRRRRCRSAPPCCGCSTRWPTSTYSLVRGPLVDWYPYPFLDPANGGYGAVAVTSVGIAVVVVGAHLAAHLVGCTKGPRPVRSGALACWRRIGDLNP